MSQANRPAGAPGNGGLTHPGGDATHTLAGAL